MSVDTARVRKLYDNSAASYDRKITVPERVLFGPGRQWAAGRTLEVAAGTGRNLPYYDDAVSLTAVDLSAGMLKLAQQRANALGRVVAFSVADAQALPFDTAQFDTVVATLALCAIPDDRSGVAEMSRVLKPGGLLVLLDLTSAVRMSARHAPRWINGRSCRQPASCSRCSLGSARRSPRQRATPMLNLRPARASTSMPLVRKLRRMLARSSRP